jgi:hypothetical protein
MLVMSFQVPAEPALQRFIAALDWVVSIVHEGENR